MPGITIHINKNGFDDAIARCQAAKDLIDEAATLAVARSVDIIHDEAVLTINKRTGRTAGTIESDAQGLTGYVGTNDKVGVILELGSTPHEIPPRVVAPRMHPGTPEYAWLQNAGMASESIIEDIFEAMVGAAFEAI